MEPEQEQKKTGQAGSSPFAMFATDRNLEAGAGVIIDYGDFRVHLRRAGGANADFKNLMQTKLRPYQKQIAKDKVKEEVMNRLLIEAYAHTVVIRIDTAIRDEETGDVQEYKVGFYDAAGEFQDDTPENRITLFKALPDLFADVRDQALDAANFKKFAQEQTVKNSDAS